MVLWLSGFSAFDYCQLREVASSNPACVFILFLLFREVAYDKLSYDYKSKKVFYSFIQIETFDKHLRS